jgi:HK97 family phage major capsid protein
MAFVDRDDEELKTILKTRRNYMEPKELKAAFDDFKAAQVKADAAVIAMVKEVENGTKESIKAATDQAAALAKQVQSLADRLVEAEQKTVKNIMNGRLAPKTIGQLVVESDAFKAFASGASRNCKITVKQGFDVRANTITGQEDSPATNHDTLVPADRRPGVIPGAFRRLRVKDLLPTGNTVSNAVEFTRELAFTNNASEKNEGVAKSQSALTFELYSAPVVTIAHWLKVSKQVKDDAPVLISYIENRLRYGVELREETEIVSGNGVNPNMIGMCTSPNFTAFTPTSSEIALDGINRAKIALENADYPATGIILNPTDWGNIERTHVSTSDERYVVGDPRTAMGPVLWGLPVVVTPSMTSGKMLIAAFDIAFLYLTRQETVVEMFEQDDTNVQSNLITIRAEKRGVLGGLRPASVRYGSLTV